MKIIVVENTDKYNKMFARPFDIMSECPRLWLKADSALLKNGKPFFIPDFTEECSAAVYVALRICRMGKSISSRFASRYYDAYSAVVDFTAEDVLRRLRADADPWDKAKSFDSSVASGDFIERGEVDETEPMTASLQINGRECSTTVCDDICAFAGSVIESVSRFFTIRQGDILLAGCPQCKPLVQINDHLTASLNGRKVLEFNIK